MSELDKELALQWMEKARHDFLKDDTVAVRLVSDRAPFPDSPAA